MLLGIDLGTSSVKALLLSPGGRRLAVAHAGYGIDSPSPGWAESDPAVWWRACVGVVRRVVAGHEQAVAAVGVTGQMHGVVLVDHTGEPLRSAILWADRRSAAQLTPYRALASEQRRRLANQPAVGMAGPTLLWLRDNEVGSYERARWALQPKDWLRFELTGEAATEPTDASGTLLYDLPGDDWAGDVISALGLRRELFPPVAASAGTAGTLLPQAAAELGLPVGIPVALGAADTAAAALSVPELAEGEILLSVGSGAQLYAPTASAHPDPTGRTHLFRAATPTGYYALAAMQNAGIALEWARSRLGATWDAAYREAFSAPAGANGLTFLPYLSGERTPHFDPEATGGWLGLRLEHTRAHLLRAAFEGVAFAIRDGLEALREIGYDPARLLLAGGGSLHPRWRQLLADTLGRPLVSVPLPATASARGAALLAGMSLGRSAGGPDAPPLPLEEGEVTRPGEESGLLVTAYHRFGDAYTKLRGTLVSRP